MGDMAKSEVVISVDSVFKSYSSKSGETAHVLSDLSIDFHEGEFTALVGPSGVGKSTLLHIIGALETADKGSVRFFGKGKKLCYGKMSSNELSEYRNKQIGFVFQFHHLLPEFSSLENVMFPSLIAGDSYSVAKKKAEQLIDTVGVAHRAKHKPSELSGGEQQRVAIARALINKPQIVIADEPTGNLDEKNSEMIIKLIKQLQSECGSAFIVATHSQEVASEAKRILTMGHGGIVNDSRVARNRLCQPEG